MWRAGGHAMIRVYAGGIAAMRRLLAGSASLALLLAAPASATDWDSVGGWDVYEVDATRCVVGRVFPEAGGATFGIIMSVHGDTRVFATSGGWSARTGDKLEARVGLDGAILMAGPATGIEQNDRRGFVTAAGPSFMDRFATAKRLTVQLGVDGRSQTLALAGSAGGLAQGRRCLDNLREERARPGLTAPFAARGAPTSAPPRMSGASATTAFGTPPRPAVAASPAVPRGARSSWIEADDYPAAALRSAQEGTVTVKLAISSSGGVAGCDILRSSGSSALDETTCRMIQRRARYRPAFDHDGRPVASFDRHTVRWTLPD